MQRALHYLCRARWQKIYGAVQYSSMKQKTTTIEQHKNTLNMILVLHYLISSTIAAPTDGMECGVKDCVERITVVVT